MNEHEFLAELRRMAQVNGIMLTKERGLLEIMAQDIDLGADFINIFPGAQRRDLLLVTSRACSAVVVGVFSPKLQWRVALGDIRQIDTGRRIAARGHVIDSVVVQPVSGPLREFWTGFNNPEQHYNIEVAVANAETAVKQINAAIQADLGTGAHPQNPWSFDPQGPEQAGAAAKRLYDELRFADSFAAYLTAIDRLNDFYVFEQFRNRQPSPSDAWLVNGLTSALGAARSQDPTVDLREGIRTATHRLRTIATACKESGANPILYERALEQLAIYAPDIDVSDIFWS